MEKYVTYLEKHKIRPWVLFGKEVKLGLITNTTFYRIIKKYPDQYKHLVIRIKNIPMKTLGKDKKYLRDELKEKVFSLYNQGENAYQIAEFLGIAKNTVYRIIKNNPTWKDI